MQSNRIVVLASVCAVAVVVVGYGCGNDTGPVLNLDAVDVAGDQVTVDDDGNPVDVAVSDRGTDSGVDTTNPPDESSGNDTGVDAPQCTDSAQCPFGKICLDRQCVSGCNGDRDCATGLHCNPESLPHGFCAECLIDNHCDTGANEKCSGGVCVATCISSDDCADIPLTPYCETTSGLCVACLSDSVCPRGKLCLDFQCKPGCRSDRDCPEDLRCDPKVAPDGDCFMCVQDADCGLKVCQDHQCVIDCSAVTCPINKPVCDPETGICLQCMVKSDCSTGNLCLGNNCVPGCEIDDDCARGLYCAQGSCVSCTKDDHCSDGMKCRANTCTSGECYKDSDCSTGSYCHPLLNSCESLPSDYCASDNDCASAIPGLLDQFCDPLTRQCIPSCLAAAFCLDLFGSGRNVCVEGGCYGCGTNSDCAGVRCDPVDRWCRACTSDVSCAVPGWHCAGDGACYECLNDGQCTYPSVCDEAGGNRCVECLTSDDCVAPSKPICGKSKTCIAACSDQCSGTQKICNPDDTTEPISILSCGDWDDDPCKEYGNSSGCGTGASCRTQGTGQGLCVCQNECTSGQKFCEQNVTDTTLTCAQNASSGCWYLSTGYCGTGEVCSSGTCVCSNTCTIGQKLCNSTTESWKCEEDYYTQCPAWFSYTCNSGYTCKNGICQ